MESKNIVKTSENSVVSENKNYLGVGGIGDTPLQANCFIKEH